MIYVVYIALALVAFLVVLNGFLAGWKFGLLAITVAFISAIVTRPIAAQLA